VNVSDNKFAGVTKVIPAHLPFILINVVGKGDLPACVLEADAHKAYPGEKLSNCFLGSFHFFVTSLLHPLGVALNSEVIRRRIISGERSE